MSDNDICGNVVENKDENVKRESTFTSIADTLKNKENKMEAIEMMSKLQELFYEHLIVDQEELIRKREVEKLEKKQHGFKMELECLEMENNKMDTYLKILTKKHELEIQYLQEVCAQKQKIADLSNNHPDIDFTKITPYGDFYREELKNVMKVNIVHRDENNKTISPAPVKVIPPPPPPANNVNTNKMSPRTRIIKGKEPGDTINVQRRATIGGSDLQSCLRSALETKFKNVGSEKEHSVSSGEDPSEWD